MEMDALCLKNEEKLALRLRSLYRRYGYSQYRMSRFEEYDLYAGNKEFLVSENVITFTDTNGRLMALKPDVTLSIVRSSRAGTGVQKVYYSENVYRVSARTRRFGEIPQTGLECIGDVDDCCIAEVLLLAAQSLQTFSPRCVLEVSHLDLLSEAVGRIGATEEQRREILRCVGEKNLHELSAICARAGAGREETERLCALLRIACAPEEALSRLRSLGFTGAAYGQLATLSQALDAAGLGGVLRIDFSVVNDMDYYNGVVFRGFVAGAPAGVLSGGQYDRLMKKLGKNARAIGFAVYLDGLERFCAREEAFDADVALLYDETASPAALCRALRAFTDRGESALACREIPQGLRYRRLARLKGSEVEVLETDA